MTGGQWGDNPPKGGGKIYRLNEDGNAATLVRTIVTNCGSTDTQVIEQK
jgi:hypothetical protein